MSLRRQLTTAVVLTWAAGLLGARQEPVGKRLSAIVGVAVEEYAKGVDDAGRLRSALEYDEATGFLREAREVAARMTSANAPAVRLTVDSLAAAADRRVPISRLRTLYDAFVTALGAEGALDLPSGPVDLARGRLLYQANCAACHGPTGGGGVAVPGGLTPPAIGHDSVMRDVTPGLTYRIVSVGIQGTAMLGFGGVLSADDRWNIVAYVNSMRASDQMRLRGRSVVARICPRCDSVPSPAHSFEWQARHSDADMAAMLRAADPSTGLAATAPLSASEADAIVAALRADAVVAPSAQAAAASDPRGAARRVIGMLEDALAAARSGRATAAADLAFDAYIAFEPIETNVRARNPGLVARMERDFADFHSEIKAGDVAGAEALLGAIEREMPAVVELAVAKSTPWGTFLESFIIILREGFEAILVLGAIVAFLIKTGHRQRVREIWIGAVAGIAASVVLAVVLRTALAALPASREIIEGATLLVAVVVLFSVSYWLLSKVEAARWQQFIRERVTTALSRGGAFALALVAFLAVFREGAETALFFQALMARGDATLPPILAGIGAGAGSLVVVFTLFYRFGVRIPLRPFFGVTSGLLYLLAFIFAGKGIKELQEGGAISRTLLPAFPHVEWLGIYPTVESVLLQIVLVALLIFALWRTLLWQRREVIPAAGDPSLVEGEPMSPEVAARLAELQVTARRLQARVETLEKEVEHEARLQREREEG